MKRTTKYVGLDVHQATTVASVRQRSGRVIARAILPTEATALAEFFEGMRGTVNVAFEEGTQAQWLHDLLVPLTHTVTVCNLRGEPRRPGNKADGKDADNVSRRLLNGDLRSVYHGSAGRRLLHDYSRAYLNAVEDSTRAMLRLKALYRARGIPAAGGQVYSAEHRAEWLNRLPDRGARMRAELLMEQIDLLRRLRPPAQQAMVREARRDSAYEILRSIPFLGPVRVSLLLATMKTPWRFRTKRNLWAYAGLAVVTETSAEYAYVHGRPVRRRRKPLTRGLNKNYNRVLKNVLKSAAAAAVGRPGPFRDMYDRMVGCGMREDMARLTLARKFAAVALRLWKQGERFDAKSLTVQST
jgi:transposase